MSALFARLGRITWLRLLTRTAQLPLRALVRMVVRKISRDPRLIVFGAPRATFTDNAAYLFLSAGTTLPGYRLVWIAADRRLRSELRAAGHRAETRWSPRGIRSCLTAGMYVYNAYPSDINRWLYDGAIMFNLWHGLPLKRIERDRATASAEHRADRTSMRAFADEQLVPDLLLSPSAYISRRCFESAFAVPADRCVNAGYPRNDHLDGTLRPPPIVGLLPSRDRWHQLVEHQFVVGYFPTWRDSHDPFLDGDGDATLRRLAAEIECRQGVLLFKPHGNTPNPPALPQTAGVTVLDPADDIHAFLPLCHLLITDYSSIAFDFMLLERPIVYHVPDLDSYQEQRGLYFEAAEAMPGTLTRTTSELCHAIRTLELNGPTHRLRAVKDLMWQGNTTDATSRIAATIDSALSVAPLPAPSAPRSARRTPQR